MTAKWPVVMVFATAGFLVSWWLVGRLRVYALRRNLLDEIGERTSHSVATPRGGGLAIVAMSLVIVASAPLWTALSPTWAAALVLAGLCVAAIGWKDDHGHVAARYRLLAHFTAALALVATVGPVPLDWLGLGFVPLEWILSLLMVVWLINLFNFMDGIDGLAASEAISAWAGLALVLVILEVATDIAAVAIPLAATVAGFLVWNRPPAKIFMGDVASGFLGLVSGALVLMAAQSGVQYAAALLVMLSAFVVDATVTLLRRALRRVAVYEAHRSHAYQILSRRWQSHGKVTLAVLVLNGVFLLPIAFLAASGRVGPLTAGLVTYIPFALAALFVGAGSEHAK